MSRIEPEDLAAVRPIGPANPSPTGTEIAYVQAEPAGTNRLRLVGRAGTTLRTLSDLAVVVEMGDGTDRRDVGGGPQWSPDGRSIALLASAWTGRTGIRIVDLATGTETELTGGNDRTPRWSPDGRTLAFVRNRDGHDDIQVIAAAGGLPLQLTYGHYDNTEPAWSPDGAAIAFVSQRSDEDVFSHSLCLVPAGGGAVVRLTHDERSNDRAPRWSPDGSSIAFVSNRDDTDDVWLTPVAAGTARKLTTGAGDKGDPQWSPDGTRLAFTRILRAQVDLAVVAAAGGESRVIQAGGVNVAPRWLDDRELIFVHSSASEPKEIWRVDITSGRSAQLTHSAPDHFSQIRWSQPEIVVLHPQGSDIEALLYSPSPADLPGPGIVLVHEGPNNVQLDGWDGLIQFLVQRGYAVIAPNYRGSTGYGRSFMEANAGERAGVDLLDWSAAAAHLASLKGVDRTRIAMVGHSAGGEATLLSLGLLSDLFRAGVAMSAPANRLTYWEDAGLSWSRRLRVKLMGLPSANRELYRRRSAITHVAAYRAPVLIIQGEDDPGVPVGQAREMAAALKAAGKHHECVIYPGEQHYFTSAAAIIDVAKRIERFLGTELAAAI